MATTILTDTRPTFARITNRGRTNSWKAAIPAVAVVVAIVILLAYMASSLSSYSTRLASADREAAASRQQLEAAQKQTTGMQSKLALAESPGRTTVVLQPASAAAVATKGKTAEAASKAWATAAWGEAADGKSWVRMNAYGLTAPGENKAYHAWLVPQTGDPALVGDVSPGAEGTSFALGESLPALDQGKQVIVSLDASDAKAPGETVLSADLPKLASTAATAAPADKAAPAEEKPAEKQ